MSRHGLIRSAAVLLALLCCVLVLVGRYPESQQYSDAGKYYGKQGVVTPDFSRVGNSTLSYRDACQNPKDSNDANLCIQRESLKAYQKQVEWAKATFFIGIFGTAAVLATVFYTIKSVRAAERSADAAIASVSSSFEVGRAQVRAYVSFVDTKATMKRIESGTDKFYLVPFFEIQIKNFGNSPAIGFKFYTTAAYLGVEELRLRNSEARGHIFGDQNIPASGVIRFTDIPVIDASLTGNDIEKFDRGFVTLIVTFHTAFTDVFGEAIYETTSLITFFEAHNQIDAVQAIPYAGTAEATAGTMSALGKHKRC